MHFTARTEKWIIVLIILAVGVWYISHTREGHRWGGDFSLYIAHAKNIAEGSSYSETGYICMPRFPSQDPPSYPPVFPVLLAPIYKSFGLNLTPMKVEVILFFLAALFAAFLALKRKLDYKYVLLIVFLLGFNPYLFDFKDHVLSDLPFLFFVLITLYYLDKNLRAQSANQSVIISAVLIYLCYATRAVGITILASFILSDIITHKRLTGFTTKVTLATIALIILQNILIPGGSFYLNWFPLTGSAWALFFQKLGQNIWYYYQSFIGILWYSGYNWHLSLWYGTIFNIFSLWGLGLTIKRKCGIYEIFTLAYLTIIVSWPARDPRFLIPVLPFYLYYFFIGVTSLSRLQGKIRWGDYLLAILMALAFSSYILRYRTFDFGTIRQGPYKKESIELFDYIKETTLSDDVFIFSKPRVLALYTGRRTATYPRTQDDEIMWRYFTETQVNYVIVGSPFWPDWYYMEPFVQRHRDEFMVVYYNSDFRVYKLIASSPQL